MTSAAFRSAGVLDDGRHPVRILAGPVAVLAAIVLVAVTDVAERRRRGVPVPASQ